MQRFSMAVSRALEPELVAEELAERIEVELGGPGRVAGGLMLATAAAGSEAVAVGRGLAQRWAGAALFGTSFEGILADGRIFRDQPAIALLAWPEHPLEPVPLVFEPGAGERDAARIAHDILDAAGRSELTPADLVLLFPDALGSPQLERVLRELGPLLGPVSLAGAAATGVDGHPAQAFFGDEALSGALLGLFVPGARADTEPHRGPLVRCAGASRAASPWLEITQCRERWVDGLDGEPPLDWVRRQLGLEPDSPIEPLLDRLLVRVRRRSTAGLEARAAVYEEHYVIGVDDRRGSFSLPGRFRRSDELALALPDPDHARDTLRSSIDELAPTPLLLQFACRSRDEALYGDPDLDCAWAAHHASDCRILGTVAPFQLAMGNGGVSALQLLVHTTVLAALGNKDGISVPNIETMI